MTGTIHRLTDAWNARKLVDPTVIEETAKDLADVSEIASLERALRAELGPLDVRKEAHVAQFFRALSSRVTRAA